MNPPIERTLADQQREIVAAWMAPAGDAIDRGDFNPPSRLKDRELNRTLAILDEIESSLKGGKA